MVGDCWTGLSIAEESGLILAARSSRRVSENTQMISLKN